MRGEGSFKEKRAAPVIGKWIAIAAVRPTTTKRDDMTKIVIDPMTRVEGHSRITIYIQEGTVVNVKFNAIAPRGFEAFVRGADANTMPHVVSRICGVCSTAHLNSSREGPRACIRGRSARARPACPGADDDRADDRISCDESLFSGASRLLFQKSECFELMHVDSTLTSRPFRLERSEPRFSKRSGNEAFTPQTPPPGASTSPSIGPRRTI